MQPKLQLICPACGDTKDLAYERRCPLEVAKKIAEDGCKKFQVICEVCGSTGTMQVQVVAQLH